MTNHKSKAQEIIGAIVIKEKPTIAKLEELLKQESTKPVEILPDGSVAVGWRNDLIESIASALREAEISGARKMREKAAQKLESYKATGHPLSAEILDNLATGLRALSPESVVEG